MAAISGGEGEKQRFDNIDVALTFAGFIAPWLVNTITCPQGRNKITSMAVTNLLWSPILAGFGLCVSKLLKKVDKDFYPKN